MRLSHLDPINAEQQAELQAIRDTLDAPGMDHGERSGPFDGVQLTGADVAWLAEQGRGKYGSMSNLHLEGASLSGVLLEHAHLRGAHLEGADLTGAYLRNMGAEDRDFVFCRLPHYQQTLAMMRDVLATTGITASVDHVAIETPAEAELQHFYGSPPCALMGRTSCRPTRSGARPLPAASTEQHRARWRLSRHSTEHTTGRLPAA